MKTINILNIILLMSFVFTLNVKAGNGTKEQPYSVTEFKAKKISSTEKYYVSGYVVGEFYNNSNNKLFYEMSPICYNFYAEPAFSGGVYILGDSPFEYDIDKCIVLQFPTTTLMDGFSLDLHPEHWRKPFVFYGTHETYNGVDGMKKINEFQVKDLNSINETDLWNYTDDFEKGTTTAPKNGNPYEYTEFVPFDAEDKWQGGIFNHHYVSSFGEKFYVTQYKIVNGILDDGKPKWDDLAISLRNENASIELISEHYDGIGEIEFWAGNYEDYSAYKMSFTLQISNDKGVTWQTFAENIAVAPTNKSTTNGMTLYRFKVNIPGTNSRFRIIKTDNNTGKGLQIDNLKFSRYKTPTAVENLKVDDFIISTQNSVLSVKNEYNVNISIFSITGQNLYNDFTNEINLPLQSGIYIVKINNKSVKVIL